MPRKGTRNPKPELRWDANCGVMVPDVTFDQGTRALLAKICDAPGFIDGLQRWTGYFLAEQKAEDTKPTGADMAKLFDDIEGVTDAFLERLQELPGHALMDIIDHEWYLRTKELPPHPEELLNLVRRFRQQIAVGKFGIANHVQAKGRTNTSAPIRNLFIRVHELLEKGGVAPVYGESGNLMEVVTLCLDAAECRRYAGSLHHYLPLKK